MSSFYYLGVGVCSLALAIYNFNVYSTTVQCYDANNVATTNIYGSLALAIAILFIILFVMSIFLSCVINSMSNQLPEDFINIGSVKKFMACFCKILPPIFIIFSWVNLILIVVIWIFIAIGDCKNSSLNPTGQYYQDTWTLNIVNSIIWVLLHYGGSIIREMTYQEPFMYSPDTGKPNCCRTLLLKKLGP